VLGRRISAGGIRDGEAVIELLAQHAGTANFIATKLVRKFVSDDPPQALVSRIAGIYRKSEGDIREMLHAIFVSAEFNSAAATKTKTPLEYVASAIRALDGSTDGSRAVVQAIGRMGQPLYLCQPPSGYPDRGDHWMSDGAILERLNFAVDLAANNIPGTEVRIDQPMKAVVAKLGSPDFQKR
jgi:uncharacterized protein (DUF1800 family)